MRGKLSAVLATAATATVLAGGATSASAATAKAANDGWGCPSGYVCIIAPDGATIKSKFYTYGAHNLSNIYGVNTVDNNQTGGATATLCYGYNGVDCTGQTVVVGWVLHYNLTPYNSIRLNRP
ncbi:hypothetical protein [Actinoplanes sp. NPDC051411]|uniref:hypothetical protein n=1 Tax=Actinoplanes sp. NPDC051411 TaxID=3155522 RepID=UPI00342FA987